MTGGWFGGGGKGDCLYDIVSSQTRFKHQQDNRNQVRYVETGSTSTSKIYFFSLAERGLRARSAQDKSRLRPSSLGRMREVSKIGRQHLSSTELLLEKEHCKPFVREIPCLIINPV